MHAISSTKNTNFLEEPIEKRSQPLFSRPVLPSFLRRFTIPTTFHNNYIQSLSLSNLILLPTTIHSKKQNYSNNSFFFSSFSSPFLYRSSFDYMETYSFVLSLSIPSVEDSRLEWGRGEERKERGFGKWNSWKMVEETRVPVA